MSVSVASIGVRLTPVLVRRSGGNVSVPAVKEMERHEDAVDLRSFQSVVGHLPVTPETDQPTVTQPGEVLRHGRLAQPDQRLQLDDRSLMFGEKQQDAQPLRIAHRTKQGAGLFGVKLFELDLHGRESRG
jgi:hypothetical protein